MGRHAARRFSTAASWFRALIRCGSAPEGSSFPLQRLVLARPPPRLRLGECDAIVCDASPWGGGALLLRGLAPLEYFAVQWSEGFSASLEVQVGVSKHLPMWEALVILLALEVWCSADGIKQVAIIGDNLGALGAALELRSRGEVL